MNSISTAVKRHSWSGDTAAHAHAHMNPHAHGHAMLLGDRHGDTGPSAKRQKVDVESISKLTPWSASSSSSSMN